MERLNSKDDLKKEYPDLGSDSKKSEPPPQWCSCRYTLVYAGFLGSISAYVARFNFPIAVVCMTDNSTNSSSETFSWDRELQGHLLSADYYSYPLSQIPAGFIADRYGGKLVCLLGLLLAALSALLLPLLAGIHYGLVIALRILIGFGVGSFFPAYFSLVAKWAPQFERSTLLNYSFCGMFLGTILAFQLGGLLCESQMGWPAVFYSTGAMGLVWCLIWWFAVHDSPQKHPRISKSELEYIHQHLEEESRNKVEKVPWAKILTSLPFYACCAGQCIDVWMITILFICVPLYMSDVLDFNIKSNGLFSSLSPVAFALSSLLSSHIADKLLVRGVETGLVRKVATGLSCLVFTGPLIALGFLDTSQKPLALVSLILVGFGIGIGRAGWMISYVDIGGRYAGSMFGISNAINSYNSLIIPIVVGVVTVDKRVEDWRTVFFACAAVGLAGTVFFIIFGSGEKQEWAKRTPPEEPSIKDAVNNAGRCVKQVRTNNAGLTV